MIKQGRIYLVNFNPSKGTEAGKIRPALVVQTDVLNRLDHPSALVMPLTTKLSSLNNLLRFRITQRDELMQDSDVMLDQMRAIDLKRFCSQSITQLNDEEWQEIKRLFCQLL